MSEHANVKRPWLPVSREAVDYEIRVTVMSYGGGIAASFCDTPLANKYVGYKVKYWDDPDLSPDTLKQIDLGRFYMATWILRSFDFGFQDGEPRNRAWYFESDWTEGASFRNSAPRMAWSGQPSPLANSKSAIGLVLETAYARLRLRMSLPLSIAQLSRLAFIDEGEILSSLDVQNLPLVQSDGLRADIAEAWLRRQPRFTPTLAVADAEGKGEGFLEHVAKDLRDSTFYRAFDFAMLVSDLTGCRLAAAAQVDPGWLDDLIHERPVACDTNALARIANCLRVDAPLFVSRAVEAILRKSGTVPHTIKGTLH